MYSLNLKISNLLVRNKCHLKFSLVVDSKYNNLDMYEKDNKYTLSNNSIEYEIYEKLIDLQRGHNYEPRTIMQRIVDLLKGYDENHYKNLK